MVGPFALDGGPVYDRRGTSGEKKICEELTERALLLEAEVCAKEAKLVSKRRSAEVP
jgi:hypothetical protein